MIETVNRQLERFMPIITPLSVVVGVMFAEQFLGYTYLIPWIFAFMTLSGGLSSNVSSLFKSFKSPFPIIIILLLLHVLMPIVAWVSGQLLFRDDYLTVTGLVLGAIIPTGITSFIWVTIFRGAISLALSIILIDTILSPFIVPFALSLLVGQKVEINSVNMMYGLLFMVVVPSLLGMFVNYLTKEKSVQVGKMLRPFTKLGLGVIVMINGAVVAPYLKIINGKLVLIAFTVFGLASVGYVIAWTLGKWFKRDRDTTVVMMFTGGMRNISVGAVIAVQYFPAPVAVPVIMGMLFQQVLASIFGNLFTRFVDAKNNEKCKVKVS